MDMQVMVYLKFHIFSSFTTDALRYASKLLFYSLKEVILYSSGLALAVHSVNVAVEVGRVILVNFSHSFWNLEFFFAV